MIEHIKKYWYAYALLVIAIVALVSYNWGMIKGMFISDVTDATSRKNSCTCSDGREYPGIPAGSARCERGCQGLI